MLNKITGSVKELYFGFIRGNFLDTFRLKLTSLAKPVIFWQSGFAGKPGGMLDAVKTAKKNNS